MPQDILLNDEFELRIENGDFVIGESTLQHQNLLLLCDKGEFKQHPRAGVGIYRYLEDHSGEDLAREIKYQFTMDGMKVESIGFNGSNLDIKAEYEDS